MFIDKISVRSECTTQRKSIVQIRRPAHTSNLAAIPFRFKAGGEGSAMSIGASSDHHHRATTKAGHKPYKPRFSSKNALRDQKKGRVVATVDSSIDRSKRKTPHQQAMSKIDRRNQAKQKRLANSLAKKEVGSIFGGKDGAPRVVAVVPIFNGLCASSAVEVLNGSLGVEMEVPEEGCALVNVERFKQRVQYICVKRKLLTTMDACRVSDYVLFVLSADKEVDDFGELMLRSIEGQGIPNVYCAVQVCIANVLDPLLHS